MFRPLHAEANAPWRGAFRADSRFAGSSETNAAVSPPAPRDDPLSDAWDAGFRTATDQIRADMAHDAAANAQVELAYARLADKEAEALAEKLRETVIALCGAVLDGASIAPDTLSRRIANALALLRRSTDEKVLRLHPDDLALIGNRLPPGLDACADSALERGALRIETGAGGVEDGPSQWREAIAAAVRAC